MTALSAVDRMLPYQDPGASASAGATATGTRIGSIHVVAWEDPVVEATGLDPQSRYVETFWLPFLGPSATWLLRRLADRLQASPDGFDLELEETARALGLGGAGGRRSPFRRAILRCARYAVVRHAGPEALAVRRRVAPLPERHVRRLPPSLQAQHRRWEVARRAPHLADVRRRARTLALDLVTVDPDLTDLERHLLRLGIHPALAYESAEWASARRGQATAVADGGTAASEVAQR